MKDPLQLFKRYEGEDLAPSGALHHDNPNLLWVGAAGAGDTDTGDVHVRLVVGAMGTARQSDGELRHHVVDMLMEAESAAQLGFMLRQSAEAAGFEVEAEVVEP